MGERPRRKTNGSPVLFIGYIRSTGELVRYLGRLRTDEAALSGRKVS